MAAKRRALDEILNLMQDVRNTSIKRREERVYERLKKNDAQRAEKDNARIPARFTGTLDSLLAKGTNYERIAFLNASETRVKYESRTYNQLTQGFKKSSDYTLLKSIIEGPNAGYYNSGLGKVDARLNLLDQYFSDDFSNMERYLTADQAKDIKAMLEAKCKSSYWKQTNEEKGYITKAKAIIAKIDDYISPPQMAIIARKYDMLDTLDNIMGKDKASRALKILENLTPSNGMYKTDEEKRTGLIEYLHASFQEAGYTAMDTPTFRKSATAVKRSRIAALRTATHSNLEAYCFSNDPANISRVNEALLLMTG